MALTFKFDPEQLERLISSIDSLSANLAKWQAEQTIEIKEGFANLNSTLGGEGEIIQDRLDQAANSVKSVKDKLQTSVNSQTKGE